MEKIKLYYPIKVDGQEVNTLNADTNALTAKQFLEASSKTGVAANKLMEINTELHMYLGAFACVNGEGDMDIMDVLRVKGYDIVQLTNIGQDMMLPDDTYTFDDKTITFENAIEGKNQYEYDYASITVEQFSKAYDKAGVLTNKFKELNDALHLYLGAFAVANANEISVEQVLEGIRGRDVIILSCLGRSFFTKPAEVTTNKEEDLQTNNSAEQSDHTQESIIAESEKLEDGQSNDF